MNGDERAGERDGFAWGRVDPANCSIGHAVATIGDRWSLLVLRELADVDRFDVIQHHLDLSRRTLAERLEAVVTRGIVERVPYREPGRRTRHRYRLTSTGTDLLPLLLALGAWSDQHRPDATAPPVVITHRDCGAPVGLHLRCAAGHDLDDADQTQPTPGPGAIPKLPPDEGATAVDLTLTYFVVVSDQDRSRAWYLDLLGGEVVRHRDPVILQVAGSTLIMNDGGGPTDDKPEVTLEIPPDPDTVSAFLNVRVGDIDQVYRAWSAKGVQFLTPPIDRGPEIRCYLRDPDGHLIEVGQSTGG